MQIDDVLKAHGVGKSGFKLGKDVVFFYNTIPENFYYNPVSKVVMYTPNSYILKIFNKDGGLIATITRGRNWYFRTLFVVDNDYFYAIDDGGVMQIAHDGTYTKPAISMGNPGGGCVNPITHDVFALASAYSSSVLMLYRGFGTSSTLSINLMTVVGSSQYGLGVGVSKFDNSFVVLVALAYSAYTRYLAKFNSSGGTVWTKNVGSYFSAGAPASSAISEIAIDANGNIYVIEYANNAINKFDNLGNFVGSVALPAIDTSAPALMQRVSNLAISKDGNYLYAYGRETTYKYDLNLQLQDYSEGYRFISQINQKDNYVIADGVYFNKFE